MTKTEDGFGKTPSLQLVPEILGRLNLASWTPAPLTLSLANSGEDVLEDMVLYSTSWGVSISKVHLDTLLVVQDTSVQLPCVGLRKAISGELSRLFPCLPMEEPWLIFSYGRQ